MGVLPGQLINVAVVGPVRGASLESEPMSVTIASNTEPLEREAERARMRLAKSLERLANPSVQEAVKQQIAGYGTRLKDQALQYVQENKDEMLEKGREIGRQQAGSFVDGLKRKASKNPLGLALIGAGIATLMRSSQPVEEDWRAYRDPYRDDQPRGYVPGGVAGFGYPEDGPGLVGTAARNLGGTVSEMSERARDAAADASEQAREAATHLAERASDAVEQARDMARNAADEIAAQASGMASQIAGRARDLGDRAAQVAQGAAEHWSGDGTRAAYLDEYDEHAGSWQEGGAVDTFGRVESDTSALKPLALGLAGLVVGFAAYGYLRSTPR
jgi:hypothetical protein